MKLDSKIFKNIAVILLTVLMLIPANLNASAANGKISTNKESADDKIRIITSLDGLISESQNKAQSKLQPESQNTDQSMAIELDFPVVAIVNNPVKIGIYPFDWFDNCNMKIEGSNGYSETLTKADDSIGSGSQNTGSCISDFCQNHYWIWTPDQVGIFNIVLYCNDLFKVSRKVYVNSDETSSTMGYLQLGKLKISTDPVTTSTGISTTIKDIPATYDKNPGQIEFSIGEPCVWSRIIKNSNLGNDPLNTAYGISEDDDGFKFSSGIYNIKASIKGINSIEYEDAKAISYKKKGLSGIRLSLTQNKHGNYYTFTANVSGVNKSTKDNLLYAFILWDESGWRLVQDYSSQNTYEFTPECLCIPQGIYRIYARVKLPDSSDNLPNSYEAEASKQLTINGCSSNIKITDVSIDTYEATGKKQSSTDIRDIDTGYEKHSCKKGFASSHELNMIKITASQPSCLEPNEYKVYAIHDGCIYSLCDYTSSSLIPFYPKSSGKYKLIVLVKGLSAGSENARKELNVTVTDIKSACKD